MKHITDPSFRYTPAAQTDLRKTFAKYRRDQRKVAAKPVSNVATLPKKAVG